MQITVRHYMDSTNGDSAVFGSLAQAIAWAQQWTEYTVCIYSERPTKFLNGRAEDYEICHRVGPGNAGNGQWQFTDSTARIVCEAKRIITQTQ